MLDTEWRNQSRNSAPLLNVCTNLKHRLQRFKPLLKKVAESVGLRPLVIVCDFSTPYVSWGYVYETLLGPYLCMDATKPDLTLITVKASATDIGNSATKDTTRYLTFIKNVQKTTALKAGHDHYVLQTYIVVDRARLQEFAVVN
ncbi:hypothetical protein HPB51_024477 [Rhipicephalus microplus]|uniref:Tick transposon n=1 Tax=Rhipicephalus microplus TaxID=6941 RepID=A0A9J6F6E8_RHIMP|nr:hypothetical protein HPB51_024477 [Rhipicephalus microplus]